MFRTSDKSEATKELQRINEEIERSYSCFNVLRTIPTLLCIEDAVGSLHIEQQRKLMIETKLKSDPRQWGILIFLLEWAQFLSTMIVNILDKGFLDCSTKNCKNWNKFRVVFLK